MATQNTPPPNAAGLSISDIYTVLFKHKWLILLFSLFGFSAAVVIYFKMRPPYQSEALLMIKYIEEDKGPLPPTPGEIRQIDTRGDGILAVETDILTSLDVARSVVDVVGSHKIMGRSYTGTNRDAVAMVLRGGLQVEVPKRGAVLRLSYRNADPQAVQPVLRQIIDSYQKMHAKVHRSLGEYDDFLRQQADEVRVQLQSTQEDLRKLKEKAGVLSLEESKKEFAERRAKLQEEMSKAETELAERMASFDVLKKAREFANTQSDQLIGTNAAPVATPQISAPAPKPSREILAKYQRLVETVDQYWRQEQELLKTYTAESFFVKDLRRQAAELEEQKATLEKENPGLLDQPTIVMNRPAADRSVDRSVDIESESIRITALMARIKHLNSEFEKLKNDLATMGAAEASIVKLQLQNEIEEKKYKTYTTSLEQTRLEAILAAGKSANFSLVQEPSPPFRDNSKFVKLLGMVAGGGIAAGLALAFLFELVVNQSVRKPGEIGSHFRLPLYLVIPEFRNSNRRPSSKEDRKKLTTGTDEQGGESVAVAPWDEKHDLHPYSEALRDRLVTFFELKNMTHKPKLIAITSCDRGAGVTSIAAGLAASLSETGEGNVLLVDMNMEQGAAHPFYKGKPACGLEDVLSHDKRGEAKINDKLYLVTGSEGDDRLPRILPKRFTHLLPKLQASDYDYIIFDMPPVTQTSVTPRLSALMDVVLLMVEAGKTNREVLKQASSRISDTKANLGIILNRRRNYIPRWLHQEF